MPLHNFFGFGIGFNFLTAPLYAFNAGTMSPPKVATQLITQDSNFIITQDNNFLIAQ